MGFLSGTDVQQSRQQLGLFPIVVAVLLVNAHGFVMVSWNLMSVLISRTVPVALETDLVDCPANKALDLPLPWALDGLQCVQILPSSS